MLSAVGNLAASRLLPKGPKSEMQTKFDPKTLQLMAEASYKAQPPPSIGDWRLLVSTPTLKLYQNKGDYILAVRGTFDASDTKADTFIPLNLLASTDRYKADLKTVEGWKGAYGGDWYATGHSLGGAICDEFLRARIVKEAYTFNPAIQPKDFRLTTNKRFYAVGDPMWTLFGQYSTGATVVPPASILKGLTQSSNPLAAHGISSFDGVGDDVLKGGITKDQKDAFVEIAPKMLSDIWTFPQDKMKFKKEVFNVVDAYYKATSTMGESEREVFDPLVDEIKSLVDEHFEKNDFSQKSIARTHNTIRSFWAKFKNLKATPTPVKRPVPPPPKREETRGERVARMSRAAFPPMQSRGKGVKGGISQFNYDAFMRESGASERMEFHSREFLPRSKRFLEAYSRSRRFMSEKERSDLDSLVEELEPLVTRYEGKSYGQIREVFYRILSYVRNFMSATPNPSSSKIGRPHPLKPARPPPAPEPEPAPAPARPSRKLGEHVGALVKKIEGKGRKPTVGAKMKRDFLAAGHTEDEFKAAKRKYRKGGVDWKSLF